MSKQLAILGYHKIGPPSPTAWETWYAVPTATFARQLEQLRDGGWRFLDAGTFLQSLRDAEVLPERAALITFDDGYRSVLEHALPVLKRLGFPAVTFVPTAAVGRGNDWDANTREPVEPICTWDELRALESAGVSVESHALTHRTFSELGAAEIEQEVTESKAAIERELGKKVELLAYPFDDSGRDPAATDDALRRAGYKAAFHFVGGACRFPPNNPFRLTRIPVWPDTDFSSGRVP